MPPTKSGSLDIRALAARYRAGAALSEVMAEVAARIAAHDDPAIFIRLLSGPEITAQIEAVAARRAAGAALPLYGQPFAIKDNIDLAGCPTTAGCPGFAYTPARSATAVERLCAAGAIAIGKTNLDQFASGLVGTRSPHGAPRNPFDANFIPGGSSSGSAVAVAAGLVSFALGTDTAGSGRVPAGFNNIVGLKPTRGLISAAGVVPACRSLDCVSVFALTCADAQAVFEVAKAYDAGDPYSRTVATRSDARAIGADFRFGVPRDEQLEFFGNREVAEIFDRAVRRMEMMGGRAVRIDFAPFARAARLLYEGPWLAERVAGIKDFLARRPEAFLDLTRTILARGAGLTAVAAFEAMYELEAIRQETRAGWEAIDVLLVPTAGTIYRCDEVKADPLELNTRLGLYTNFANLLDLCGLAVPAGFGGDGLPAGVTLLAPAGRDLDLLRIGGRFHRDSGVPLGATGHPIPAADAPVADRGDASISIGVLGAHLSGQPLNWQLTDRGGRLVRTCRTAPAYRFYALPGTVPAKPGMVRAEAGQGLAIELEVWALDAESFGTFVAAIPPPLVIGSVELEDRSWVKGFLCESHALAGARDISAFGGWRAFLAATPR